MKKTILILISAVALSACVTVDKYSPGTSGEYSNNPEGFTLLENNRTQSVSKVVYVLFIPFGGKSVGTMQAECYNNMLKNTNADGVFLQTFIETRKRYPFFSKTVTELSGRPYKIKLAK